MGEGAALCRSGVVRRHSESTTRNLFVLLSCSLLVRGSYFGPNSVSSTSRLLDDQIRGVAGEVESPTGWASFSGLAHPRASRGSWPSCSPAPSTRLRSACLSARDSVSRRSISSSKPCLWRGSGTAPTGANQCADPLARCERFCGWWHRFPCYFTDPFWKASCGRWWSEHLPRIRLRRGDEDPRNDCWPLRCNLTGRCGRPSLRSGG